MNTVVNFMHWQPKSSSHSLGWCISESNAGFSTIFEEKLRFIRMKQHRFATFGIALRIDYNGSISNVNRLLFYINFDLLFFSSPILQKCKKSSVTLRYGWEWWCAKERLYWISCATHTHTHAEYCMYASCSDIVSSETWITSSFDLSFAQISLGQWNFMVARIHNRFKLWLIPNVLSRKKIRNSPLGMKTEKEISSLSVIRVNIYFGIFMVSICFALVSFFFTFSVFSHPNRNASHLLFDCDSIWFDGRRSSVSGRHEPKR